MARNAIAFEVPDHQHPDARKAGAFYFMYRWDTDAVPMRKTDDRIGIIHACPCGCGFLGAIWFRGKSLNGSGTSAESEWDVVGEWPKVTLAPSIGFARQKDGSHHWHGYLENGVFVER